MGQVGIAERNVMECRAARVVGLLRFDVGRPDHLAPLLGFLGNELAEIGRRAGKYRRAQVGQPRFKFGVRQSGVDLYVELVDAVSGRVPRHANAEPRTRLVTRHEFAHGREVRQGVRTRRCRHRERTQPAGPDVPDRFHRPDEYDLHLPAEKIGERRRASAIWHVNHVDAGHHLE